MGFIDQYIFREDGSGSLLPLNEDKVKYAIDKGGFFVAESENNVIGCCSIVGYNGIAELRTLVVYPKYKRKGIGSTLVETCKNKAREIGYESLYALVKPDAYDFFRKQGFEDTQTPPEKMEKDCLECPLYNNGCNEIPIVFRLDNLR